MDNLAEVKPLIDTRGKQIVITTHHKPDADAIGSSLAVAEYLSQKGHHPRVISPSDYPRFLHWLHGNESVMIYDKAKEEADALIMNADMIFCLDFSSLSRINDMETPVRKSNAVKVLIDHHTSPETFADYTLSREDAAATAELIYEWIVDYMGDSDLITVDMAEALYAGVMTDTGGFRFPATSRKIHELVADLMGRGIDHSKIHYLIYENSSEMRMKLLGFLLCEKLVVIPEYNTAYLSITAEELIRFEAETGDTEGFVNYALAIEGIVFAAIFVDRDSLRKISFRSRGSFPVNEFARDNFEGGGHKNAAGGKSVVSLEKTIEKFLSIVPKYKEQLTLNTAKIQC